MRRLKISALGPVPPQEIPAKNESVRLMREHWERQFDQVFPDRPDVVVLPECCDRFPRMSLRDRLAYYHEHGAEMLAFFRQKALDNHCFIAFAACRELPDGTRRNSTRLIGRGGEVLAVYDKNYPVICETEQQNILPGKAETVAETELGKVGFVICFDLNFTELLERYAAKKPDLLLFSSMYHGGLMQSYWAYRCRSYFAGAVAGNECAILDPLGHKVACSTNYHAFVTADINTDYEVVHLDGNREKLLQAKKKYGPGITVFDPGRLGCVLVTSEMREITAAQVVEEFSIERLDDYFRRSADFARSR
ncbi:MAG: carbon-nitrogen hydrolase family protein [Lentisphaeria bacterium]|nr:carbon-nitrogen hydrolase family protein [Lentisphaeria bacterium]